MQTTLLGLGIAIIVALVAALVGPYFIDWSAYRATFEKEATRIVGMPVTIGGKIDARLLPVPSLTLHNLEGRKATGEPKFAAKEISVEFALGPLLRGQLRISEMHIAGPRIGVGLSANGRVDWVGTEAGIDPNSLAIEHLTVDDGRVILADAASGSWMALNKFTFAGALRSLAGPIKGDGSFVTRDGSHGYHLSAGRLGDDGTMHVRLSIDPAEPPVAADLDGTLRFDKAAPQFDGTLKLARQAGVSLVQGRAVANPPWTLTGKVATTSAHAMFKELQLQYGADDRALNLTGTAELKFGTRPRLDAVVAARQLDLDRFAALPEQTRQPPMVAARAVAASVGSALMPTIPVHVGLSIDVMTVGAAALQNVRGDFSADERGWSIDTLELRAPGITQVRASGRLNASPKGASFSGPAKIDSADPKALAAWLEGTAVSGLPLGELHASGDVTLAPDHVVVDRLTADLDHKSIAGHIDYAWEWQGKGPRLEAALNAADLDIDGAVALVRNALPGVSLDLPLECVLALDIGHATVAGVEARRTKAKLRLDANGLAIDELTIGDLAGAAVAASGHVQGPWSAPTGTLTLAVDGQRLDGLAVLLRKAAPQAADALSDVAPRLGPAKLKLALVIDHAHDSDKNGATAPATTATFRLDGTVGALRVVWTGDARGDPTQWKSAALRSDVQLDAADGRQLATLIGLEQMLTVSPGTGSLHLNATSALNGALAVTGRLALPGVLLTADGVTHLDGAPSGRAEVAAIIVDAKAMRPLTGRADQAAPLNFKARLAFDGGHFTIDNLAGRLADSNFSGALTLATGHPLRIDGRLDADRLHADALVAGLAGMPLAGARPAPTNAWPTQPFSSGFLGNAIGRIAITATHASLGPRLDVQQWRATLRLRENEAALEDIHGTMAGGQLTGSASLQRGADGVSATFRAGLKSADLAALLPAVSPPPIAGRVSLQAEAKGSGRSPEALVEALGGFGSISAEGLELKGLDPAAFDSAARLADQSSVVDNNKLKAFVEPLLDRNVLRVPHLDGAFTLSAGQLRLGGVVGHADNADVSLTATADLAKSNLDARVTLAGSGAIAQSGGRPVISILLKGPLTAPARTVDISALSEWLTLRAVDQQAKRVEAAEAERRKADDAAHRMEDAARQAAEKQRAAAEAAEQQRRAAEAAAPPAGPTPSTSVEPPAGPAAALPPPIEIRPIPNPRRNGDARPAPHVARPEQESVLRPPRTFRDPRLPP